MKLRRISIENVRSFLDRADLLLDGPITIAIGPNGGGKTNLLDITAILLRRYLLSSIYAVHVPTPEQQNRYEFRSNDALNSMVLDRYTGAGPRAQVVEGEIEVTARDIENMATMREQAAAVATRARAKYVNVAIENARQWKVEALTAGQRFVYRVTDGTFSHDGSELAGQVREYLQIFEVDSRLREEYELAPLSTPMLYLPVNRTATGFQSSVQLAGYNEFEQKRQNDAALSRTNSSVVALAIGRLAQRYRLLLEKDKGTAAREFREDKNLQEMTKALTDLGYEWELESVDPLKNHYDIRLKKQGSSFLVGGASSGERELLTYLFAIYALNVRDALIVVDEPELHLHPQWQKTLLALFGKLAESTGNQFLFATHSPTFISPESVQYVSRVFSREQRSHILRLDTSGLPESRHLMHIVNSQNNERLFFADKVLLVEGLHDRIVFEAILKYLGRDAPKRKILEVISVGGKGFFEPYRRLLDACQIEHASVADLDYVDQIGPPELKALFRVDADSIKKDVIENVGSVDGATLASRIDHALLTGTWADARETWEYIKGRRLKLRADLRPEDRARLDAWLAAKAADGVFVLSRGDLEAYLPDGYRSKDLDKLLRFIAERDFWQKLPEFAQAELSQIAGALLDLSDRTHLPF